MPFAWNEATQHLEMVNQRDGSGSGGEDAPGVPRNVRVTEVGAELVVVEWDPPTGGGAVSYTLYYRSPNGPEESLGNMNTLGSRVSGPVVPGECYRVTAVNAAGVEGEKSPEVCVWPQQSPDGGGGGGGPAALENPANGSFYSGLGVISGWKCTANGPLTVRFNGGAPLPLAYGNARADVRNAGACPSAQVGFVSIMNWAELGDGEHTAVVYDDGGAFARSTFTVATTGEPYVAGAEGECRVSDFPAPGETMPFAWNEATQHLEMVGVGGQKEPEEETPVLNIPHALYGNLTRGDRREVFKIISSRYGTLIVNVTLVGSKSTTGITAEIRKSSWEGQQWRKLRVIPNSYGVWEADYYDDKGSPTTTWHVAVRCMEVECDFTYHLRIRRRFADQVLPDRYAAGDPEVWLDHCYPRAGNSDRGNLPHVRLR